MAFSFAKEARDRLAKAKIEARYGNCRTAYRALVNAGLYAGIAGKSGEEATRLRREIRKGLTTVNTACLRK